MSGQATAAAPAVRASGAAAPARPLTLPPRPRRVSGPARRKANDRPARGRTTEHAGIARGLVAALDGLARRRALGGPTWIGLVAFALIGIVTLQLGLLKLNASVGRSLEHEAALQRENAALSIENSELGTSTSITAWAARRGMEPVSMGALRFLAVRPRIDVRRGASALSASTAGSGEAPGAGSTATASSSASSTTTEQSPAPASAGAESPDAGSSSSAGESAATAASPSAESSARAPEGQAKAPEASAQTPAAATSAGEGAGGGPTEVAQGGGTGASPSG